MNPGCANIKLSGHRSWETQVTFRIKRSRPDLGRDSLEHPYMAKENLNNACQCALNNWVPNRTRWKKRQYFACWVHAVFAMMFFPDSLDDFATNTHFRWKTKKNKSNLHATLFWRYSQIQGYTCALIQHDRSNGPLQQSLRYAIRLFISHTWLYAAPGCIYFTDYWLLTSISDVIQMRQFISARKNCIPYKCVDASA